MNRGKHLAAWFALGISIHITCGAQVQWERSVEIAKGLGYRGAWQQNNSKYDFVDDPSVAINENGTTHVVWVDQRRKDAFFRSFSPGLSPLSKAINISASSETFTWLPRIVLAPDKSEMIYILWQEIVFSGGSHGGDICFARSTEAGKRFSKPLNISNSVGGDGKGRLSRDVWHNGSLDIAAGSNGLVYATWTEYDGLLWVSASGNHGENFSAPLHVEADVNNPARAPTLALGNDGTVYLAWTVGEDKSADIRLAKSTDQGRSFTKPRVVAKTEGYSDSPKLATDSRGFLHLVFTETQGHPSARAQILYSRSHDGGESFSRAEPISPSPTSSVTGAGFPSLEIDGHDRLFVVWELMQEEEVERPRGLGLAISGYGGQTFSKPVVVPGTIVAGGGYNGSTQGLLMKKLSVNGRGQFAIVNSTFKPGAFSSIWLTTGAVK